MTIIKTLAFVVCMTQAVEAAEVTYGPVLMHETEMHEIDMTNAYEYAIEQILIEYVLADDPNARDISVRVQDKYYPDGVYKYAVCIYTSDGQSYQEDYWMETDFSLT